MTTLTHDDIRTTLQGYLQRFPGERAELGPLVDAMERSHDVTSRHEFNGGHVTCGAVVIDHDRRLLLVRHKTLQVWLLPGGHVEPQDSGLIYGALRELEEETGIAWFDAVSPPGEDIVPIDIDLHEIPANPAKNEPAHWHADFRYAFWVKEPEVYVSPEESDGYAWRPLEDAPTTKLANKIANL